MSARKELADAASTVSGVEVAPEFYQTTRPGSGYVRMDRVEFPDKFGGVFYWNVIVILPADQAAAERQFETWLPELYEALSPHFTVDQIVPQRLSITGSSDLLCAFVNGHREE